MKRIAQYTGRKALLALALATCSSAQAVDLKQRLEVSTDIREPEYAQVIYEYHLGHHFAALNKLLFDKSNGIFGMYDADTEMLFGDLYTEFGMPREGDVAISRVQDQDIPSSTRNAPWLRYGKLLYQLGNDAPTENYLRKAPPNLTSYLESERRLMLANILIRKKSYAEAIAMLQSMPGEGVAASYGQYNLGIAYLADGQLTLGIEQLNRLIDQVSNDAESLNLRDKAALAVAYHFLRMNNYPKARESLLRVRLEGPYSNAALLAMAYSRYLNQEYAETLPACLELQRRNPADPAVQEAFLLGARAYEELNFKAQALAGYKMATQVLRDQLGMVERSAYRIDQPTWPDILTPGQANTEDADPLNVKPIPATNNAITAGLFSRLFASPAFNEGFRQYQQLQRLVDMLDTRRRDVQALQDVAQTMSQREAGLADQRARLQTMRDSYLLLVKRWQDLQIRFKQMNSNADAYTDAASQTENARLQQLNRLNRKLQRLKTTNPQESKELQAQLNRLRAVTQFEVARHAASRDEIFDKLQQVTAQLRETKVRLAALDRLVTDNQAAIKSVQGRDFPQMLARIDSLQQSVSKSREEYREYLRNLAKTLLDERRTRLTNYLGETYLGTERIESAVESAAKAGGKKS